MTTRLILRLRAFRVALGLATLICVLAAGCGGGGGGSATPVGTAAGVTAVQPSSTLAGATATFIANVTGTAPLTYVWNFGGGATPNESTAASPSVVLGAAGTYSCSVTVDNTYGSPAVYNFTLNVITGGGGGVWPTDATQLAWVTTWYTTLPALGSAARVFQDANYTGYADEVYTRINAARAAEGLGALAFEPHLEALAQAHSAHMATAAFFSHTNPEGLDPSARLGTINPPSSSQGMAENIAAGQDSPENVMTGWLASSIHRDNILDTRWTHVGVGVYGRPVGDPQGYGIYWTTVFYAPDGDPAAHAWIEPGDTP